MQPLPSQRKDRSRYISELVRDNKKREVFLSLFCLTAAMLPKRFPIFFKAVLKIKRLCSVFTAFFILFSSLPSFAAPDYDEEGAYRECCILYPDFVDKVISCGATDKQLLNFVKSVEAEILNSNVALTVENFDTVMFAAFKSAFKKRSNLMVRNALSKAYPDSAMAAQGGVITEEFMPVYITVKRFLFSEKTPVITLSCNDSGIFVHYVNMPDDFKIIVALYDEEGALISSHTNYFDAIEYDKTLCTFAKAFALDKSSLAPLCDSVSIKP